MAQSDRDQPIAVQQTARHNGVGQNPHSVQVGCPYLGLADDPGTGLLFVSEMGYCHRAKPAAAVHLAHQQSHCLTAVHTTCPVFMRQEAAPLPAELQIPEMTVVTGGRRWFWGGITAVFLLLLAAAAYQFYPVILPAPQPTPTQAAVQLMPTATPSSTRLATAPPTASKTAVPSHTPTATPTATPTTTPTLPPTYTPIPTHTPLPEPTSLPAPQIIINVDAGNNLNIRLGPGLEYPILFSAPNGERYTIIGQLPGNSWWQVCCVAGNPGWVSGDGVLVEGNTADIPVVTELPPTPTP